MRASQTDKRNPQICFYCGKYYENAQDARECENSHDVVHLPILREDLNRLLNFLVTGEKKLVTERLWNTLFRHVRSK